MASITNILVPLASVTPNIQVLPIFFVLSHNQKYLGSRDGHEYFSDSQRDLQEPSSTPGPSFVFLSPRILRRMSTERFTSGQSVSGNIGGLINKFHRPSISGCQLKNIRLGVVDIIGSTPREIVPTGVLMSGMKLAITQQDFCSKSRLLHKTFCLQTEWENETKFTHDTFHNGDVGGIGCLKLPSCFCANFHRRYAFYVIWPSLQLLNASFWKKFFFHHSDTKKFKI